MPNMLQPSFLSRPYERTQEQDQDLTRTGSAVYIQQLHVESERQIHHVHEENIYIIVSLSVTQRRGLGQLRVTHGH